MTHGARENGDRGNRQSDEAALSARLQRLGEKLACNKGADQPSDSSGADRTTTASSYARGFRLSSEFVAGVIVGAGLGWLIDRSGFRRGGSLYFSCSASLRVYLM